jgi:hypothetical protein
VKQFEEEEEEEEEEAEVGRRRGGEAEGDELEEEEHDDEEEEEGKGLARPRAVIMFCSSTIRTTSICVTPIIYIVCTMEAGIMRKPRTKSCCCLVYAHTHIQTYLRLLAQGMMTLPSPRWSAWPDEIHATSPHLVVVVMVLTLVVHVLMRVMMMRVVVLVLLVNPWDGGERGV